MAIKQSKPPKPAQTDAELARKVNVFIDPLGQNKAPSGKMTVGELKKKLSQFPDEEQVVVHWEDGSFQMGVDGVYLEIDEVTRAEGTPTRKNGKAGYRFESNGPANWVFITVSPA